MIQRADNAMYQAKEAVATVWLLISDQHGIVKSCQRVTPYCLAMKMMQSCSFLVPPNLVVRSHLALILAMTI